MTHWREIATEDRSMTTNIRSRAIGYARTAVANPEGIARQVREIREYCDRHAIVLVEMVTACGESGIQPFDERGGQTIKEIVRRDVVDTLIVADVARLSRNLADLARIVDWLDEHEVGIYLVGDEAYYRPRL